MSNKHYIDNKRFEELIKLYKKNPDVYENDLFEMFDILISNIITGFSFKLEEEDAKQECFLLILKTLKNFNPEMGNAFNYFTTIILNNLKLLYTKNKKYNQKIDAYIDLKKDLL
jgi:DNA-directed RNA polymerase specialized sigma subunit